MTLSLTPTELPRVWEITSDGSGDETEFLIGTVPQGYEEVVALEEPLVELVDPDTEVAVVVNDELGSFRLSELDEDLIHHTGGNVTEAVFIERLACE